MPGIFIGNSVIKAKSNNWASYWATHYLTGLAVTTTSDTTQTITATINGIGADGVSWEYSTDLINWTVKGTSILGSFPATGLTGSTLYFWRARLYKGSNFGDYSNIDLNVTEATQIRHQTGGVNDVVAWYDSQDLTTITKDVNDFISRRNDKLGSGHDLIQADGAKQFHWSADGTLADGINDFMKTAGFTFGQPEFIFMVIKQKTFHNNCYLFDGNAADSGIIYQHSISPIITPYVGVDLGNSYDLIIDKIGIIRLLFNGASSKLIINDNTPVTGSVGAGDMGGFTLGSNGSGTNYFANIEDSEIILNRISLNSGDETAIYNYLKSKYSLQKKIITFNNTGNEALTDYMAEINLTVAPFATLFYFLAGSTLLDYYIDSFDLRTGAVKIFVKISIPADSIKIVNLYIS
jgi:hypothetical protein